MFNLFKALILYLFFCALAWGSLFLINSFIDIENIAELIYKCIYSHYGWYAQRDKYDFNPALGDLLIGWILVLPAVMVALYLLIKKK